MVIILIFRAMKKFICNIEEKKKVFKTFRLKKGKDLTNIIKVAM
jgi:hypothetical protein